MITVMECEECGRQSAPDAEEHWLSCAKLGLVESGGGVPWEPGVFAKPVLQDAPNE